MNPAPRQAATCLDGVSNEKILANFYGCDMYIEEMGGQLVTIGNQPGNLHIGGYRGYVATLRHPDGQFATVAVIPTEAGVLEVEVGVDTRGRERKAEFESLLTGLLTEKEVR